MRFRFTLGSYGYSNAPGWYLDDLQVFGSNPTVAVASAPVPVSAFCGRPSPSPGAGAMTLELSLTGPTRLEARVYDAGGRLVRRLQDRLYPAGAHRLRWDGRDGGGQRVAAGVYFLRLDADRRLHGHSRGVTRKLVVID